MRRILQPHLTGLIYAGLVMLVGVAAVNNQNNLLFWVLGVMIAGLVISAGISMLVVRGLRVRRIDPQHGAVGEPLIVRYAVRNRSRLLSAFSITLEERPEGAWRRLMAPAAAWVMHIGPRETVHGEAIFWPTRRGEVAFDRIRVATTFPFGIIRKSAAFSQPQHTLIYPRLYELRRDLLRSFAPKGLMGTKVSHHAGAGDDYYGTREHRPGDSMRHIAWKLAARTDQLVTIERTTPSPAKLRVILDLTTPTDQLHVEPASREKARDLEESAISLSASLVHAADADGYEVGLTVLGTTLPAIPGRRNPWHLHKIMAALAGIDLDGPRQQARPQPIRDAERAAIVVVAPDRISPLIGAPGRDDALYLSARQLDSLAVRPIGWEAVAAPAGSAASAPLPRPRYKSEAAA